MDLKDIEFGAPVYVRARLQRDYGSNPEYKHRSQSRSWRSVSLPHQQGALFIGERTLSNGDIEWLSDDEPGVYRPDKYFKAALVVTDRRENPFYVLPGDVSLNPPPEQRRDK